MVALSLLLILWVLQFLGSSSWVIEIFLVWIVIAAEFEFMKRPVWIIKFLMYEFQIIQQIYLQISQ